MRDRIASVGSTKKITDAMKLVAAAKVRKAQDAVINARPFSEQLVKVLFAINGKLAGEDVEAPLCAVRPVKTCLIMLCTGDRVCAAATITLPSRSAKNAFESSKRKA